MTRLAVDGGTPVRSGPYPPWPFFADDERAAVDAVLASGRVNYWTGTEGRAFEDELAAFTGRRYAIALANGTVALELALWVLGIGEGDEVVVPARTFIATASAVAVRGAVPVVADVDRRSQNMTADTLRDALTQRTKAVIPVHLGGWPCDMDPIMDLARERGLRVVEDCAQALGASYKGRPVGSIGNAGAFSFCQDKVMTTGGEGGALVLDDRQAFEMGWSLKDHGKDHAAVHDGVQHSGCTFRWLHERFGTNWRMTEMQAAIGRAALPKVPGWVDARRANAAVLHDRLSQVAGLRTEAAGPDERNACYRYYVFVRPERLADGWTRDRVIQAVTAEGVPCGVGSCPEIQRERAFSAFLPERGLPVAAELGETSIVLLVHPTLTEADMRDTADAVAKVMEVAAR